MLSLVTYKCVKKVRYNTTRVRKRLQCLTEGKETQYMPELESCCPNVASQSLALSSVQHSSEELLLISHIFKPSTTFHPSSPYLQNNPWVWNLHAGLRDNILAFLGAFDTVVLGSQIRKRFCLSDVPRTSYEGS